MVVVVGNAGGGIGRNSGELRDTQSSPEQKKKTLENLAALGSPVTPHTPPLTRVNVKRYTFINDLLEILGWYKRHLCDYSWSFFPPNLNLYISSCLTKWRLDISHRNIFVQCWRWGSRCDNTNLLSSIL